MLTISAELDRTGLMKTISGLAAMGKSTGLTARFLCWDVMRAWCLDMVKRTAPWAGEGTLGTYAAQKKAGFGAVQKDIDRAFARNEKRTVAAWERDGTRFVKIKESGVVFSVPGELWEPDIEQRHKRLRTAKGRVPRQQRQAWVDPQKLKEYTKAVQSRVGALKAGWIPSLYHYASLSRGSTGRLPQWILGQGKKMGGYSGNMSDNGNGSISAENTAPHSKAIRRDTVEYSRKLQQKNLERFGKVRIQRLCDQFNGGKTPKAELRSAA